MILLIHTCGAEALAALCEEDRVLAEEHLPGREASEKLVPALGRLLAQARGLRAVGVVHGPGSFTGVRVGLSAAKGLCEARGIGMVAMSRLALFATEAGPGESVALLDAGRGEFYCGFAQDAVVLREAILTRAELLSWFHDPLHDPLQDPLQDRLLHGPVLTCEPRVQESLAHEAGVQLRPEPGAATMLAMVRARIACGAWSDVATIDANYLRRTDAELLRERS